MLEPGQPVAQQRLAQPDNDRPAAATAVWVTKSSSRAWPKRFQEMLPCVLLQLDVGRLVLQLVPFVLEVFLEEVAVADRADLGGELEAVGQLLAVLPEEAVAVIDVGHDVRAVDAQVVEAAVVDAPVIDQAGRLARECRRGRRGGTGTWCRSRSRAG